jgi:hypothetical protein
MATPSKPKAARKPKSFDSEMVPLLRGDAPKPKGSLRERTNAALKLKADKEAAKVEAQVLAFYEVMNPIADTGLCEGDYRKGLSDEAIKILKADGIKIRDNGDGVCCLYTASW